MLTQALRRHEHVAVPVVAGLAALAWVVLLAWGSSPWAGYLAHDGLAHGDVLRALVVVVGWTVMVAAMMLPASLPLVQLFTRMTRDKPHPGRLVALLVAGYLAVWAAVGAAAVVGDAVVHELVEAVPGMSRVVAPAVLVAAGIYQFSEVKHRCLDRCRVPYSFLVASWRGSALRLGLKHGSFCVGCCIATMVVMFGMGMGNPGWMLLLGAEMALERNAPWGRRLAHPVGVALLVAAGFVAAG